MDVDKQVRDFGRIWDMEPQLDEVEETEEE